MMNKEKCQNCDEVKDIAFRITELVNDGNYISFVHCIDCGTAYLQKDKIENLFDSTEHIQSIKELKKFLTSSKLKKLKLKYASALELERYEELRELKNQIDELNWDD